MTFRSDWRQALILFLTSNSSRSSSSSIVTWIVLRASRICPREQNEPQLAKFSKSTETVSGSVSLEHSGSSTTFLSPRIRNSLPRLLTRLEDLWLMNLREPPEENGRRPQQDLRTRLVPLKQRVVHKTQTRRSVNVKAH